MFAELGVTKVRLTGGEPLLRKDILDLTRMLGDIPGLSDIPLSTNAHLLPAMALKLKNHGINRANISIDSLIPERFKEITRDGDLETVINGIDAAISVGMKPIKLNMVVMKGTNDDEIESMIEFAINRGLDLRFIETMPIGLAGIDAVDRHYSEKDILDRINKIKDRSSYETIKTEIFGKKGIITELFKKIGSLNQNEKKEYASKLNSLKTKITEIFEKKLEDLISNGSALEIFGRMVSALGGPIKFTDDWNRFLPEATVITEIPTLKPGYLNAWHGHDLGNTIVTLGGGRRVQTDIVDPSVGLDQIQPLGSYLNEGDIIARVHASRTDIAREVIKKVQAAAIISSKKKDLNSLFFKEII